MEPEYSFDEAIELIRWADLYELKKLGVILTRDKREYCLYHVELLAAAIDLKIKYTAQEDAREFIHLLRILDL